MSIRFGSASAMCFWMIWLIIPFSFKAAAATDSLQIWKQLALDSMGRNPTSSLKDGLKMLEIARKSKNSRLELDAGMIIAESSMRLFKLDLTHRQLFQLLDLSNQLNDKKIQAQIFLMLGKLHWLLEDPSKSSYYYAEAARESSRTGNLKTQLLANASMAYIQIRRSPPGKNADFNAVKEFYQHAITTTSDTATMIQASNLMGNVASLRNMDPEITIRYYEQAIRLSRLSGDAFQEANYLQNKAEIYLKEGKIPAAEAELGKSLLLGRITKSDGLIFSGMRLLAECAAYRMDFNKAYEYQKAYEQIRSRHLNESQLQRTEEKLLEYMQKKRDLQEKELEMAQERAKLEAEKAFRVYQLYVLGSLFSLLLLIGYFFINRMQIRKLKEKQKLVDDQNQQLEFLNNQLINKSGEAEKAREEALSALRGKMEFISVITHEIRTPLHAVIGAAQLLHEAASADSRGKQNIETLKFAADNLLGLINNVLDFNRIEAGKIELVNKPFSLRELLNGMFLLFSPQAKEKGLSLHFRIDEKLPDAFSGDRLRLSQILTNLLANAIRFTSKGSITVEVHYAEEITGGLVRISVEDSGIGLSMDEADRILGFFNQANPGIQRKYGGFGLGLTITAKLLHMMNSALEIQSIPGKGSVFSFSLRLPEENHMLLAQHALQITEFDFARFRILFVEDVAYNRILARRFFEKWRIPFDMAETGQEAVQLVGKYAYDLIIMDIRLPDISGCEASILIRNQENGKSVPILAMTAFNPDEVEEEIKTAGMQDLLSKPFEPEDLRQALILWLGKKAG